MSPRSVRIAFPFALLGLLVFPSLSGSSPRREEAPVRIAPIAAAGARDEAAGLLRWSALPGANAYFLFFARAPFDPPESIERPGDGVHVRRVTRNWALLSRLGLPARKGETWHWTVGVARHGKVAAAPVRPIVIPPGRGKEPPPLLRKGSIARARPARRSGEVVLANGHVVVPFAGKRTDLFDNPYWIVRFEGPIRDEWRRALAGIGATPLAYLPQDAYIVRGRSAAMHRLTGAPGVAWIAPYDASCKLSPSLDGAAKGGAIDVVVLLHRGESAREAAYTLARRGIEVTDRAREILRVRAAPEDLPKIASLPPVRWIERERPLSVSNNDCQWVVQTDVSGYRSVWQEGLRGEGILIGACDSGILPTHDMFRDDLLPITGFGDFPDHRKLVAYRKATEDPLILFGDDAGSSYHGTHTACTLAGNDTTRGTSPTDGIAPAARLFFVDGGGSTNAIYTPVDLGDLFLTVYEGNGAGAPRIMSNSWGAGANGAYDYRCEQVDRFVWERKDFLLVFSNGNGGMASSVTSPASAKNCIGAGGTENGTQANEIYAATSRGPTEDGRTKPTVCAPARLYSASGSADDAYQTLDGTSMAAPSLASSAALIRQYFLEGRYPSGIKGASAALEPSAALLRAMLVNGGRDDIDGCEIPSNDIGWGRLRLEDVLWFPDDTRRLAVADERAGLLTGETATFEVTVASGAEPLEVTLVWTDYPSTPAASANLVSDLDLAVSGGGGSWLGNVFAGGASAAGGVRDSLNVEECVLLPSPLAGTYTIEVRAFAVPFGPQPYALVVTGDLDATAGAIALDRASYGGADTIVVRLEDEDAGAAPRIALWSDTETEPESLSLSGGGGLFTGALATSTCLPAGGDGFLSVSHGDSIHVAYADDSPPGTRSASAVVLLRGPVILAAGAGEPGDASAIVHWRTDGPADSKVLFGLIPGVFTDTVASPDLVVDHAILLDDLLPDTTYTFAVSSADFRGNRTEDDGGGERYRLTTGPRADALVVIGDLTFEKRQAYEDALDRFGWRGRIVEGTVPATGDRERGLRSHPVVWWQAGWEEYPPFGAAARDTIARYLGGGGRLAVVSHDAAWALGDPFSPYRSAETEAWLAENLKVVFSYEPSFWSILFGVPNDPISGSYATMGVDYTPFRSFGAGDEIAPAPFAGTIDSVWTDNDGGLVGLRWVDGSAAGTPDSAVWGGSPSRGVTCCFEWSQMNASTEDDYHRGRIFDQTIRWLVGRDHPDVTLTKWKSGGTITAAPASIEWNETTYGGAGVGSRRVEWSGDGGASWIVIDGDAGASPVAWDLAGVPNGTAVRIRVTLFDGGDPPLTGADASDANLTIAIDGNDTRGPRVVAGSGGIDPDPAPQSGSVALTALLSDSTRGGSPVTGAEWSLGPAAPGEGSAMGGTFGAMTAAVIDTMDASLLSPPLDTIWIRGLDAAGSWGEASPVAVTIRGDFTGVAAGEDAPALFRLRGNAPNPFNPTTTIRFDLPERAPVRLSIYEATGRLVRRLADADLPAGSHEAIWDGRDDRGREAGSGVYVVRLVSGERAATRKIVLLR